MAEVKVYGYIGQSSKSWDKSTYISGAQFEAAITEAAAQNTDSITVSIHSGGGSVTDGYLMLSAMKKAGKPVKAVIDGYAASMGYFITLGASEVTAAKNSIIMLHSVQGGGYGSPEDLRDTADVLDKFNATVATLLAERTGMTEDEVKDKYLGKEVWLTAQEALDAKLIDGIEAYEAQNVPAVSASMTYTDQLEVCAKIYTEDEKTTFMNEILAKVRDAFGLTEKTNQEVTAQMNEDEKQMLNSILYDMKFAADSAAYALEEAATPEAVALLTEIKAVASDYVVKITQLIYGAQDAQAIAAGMQEVKAEREQKYLAAAEQAAISAVTMKLSEKDTELAAANAHIEALKAKVEELGAQAAAVPARVVANVQVDGGEGEEDERFMTSYDQEKRAMQKRF